MIVEGKDLRKLWKEKGKARTLHFISEGIERGDFTPDDFSLKDLSLIHI